MVGSGYVGLVSGACFAEFGADVTCVDQDQKKIEALNEGQIPIYEPGLDALISRNTKEGRLNFTSTPDQVIGEADLLFIAVGTPSRRGEGITDLSYMFEAAEQIAPVARKSSRQHADLYPAGYFAACTHYSLSCMSYKIANSMNWSPIMIIRAHTTDLGPETPAPTHCWCTKNPPKRTPRGRNIRPKR